MPSFTFSSNTKRTSADFVGLVLASALAFLALYSACIYFFPPPSLEGQDQEEENEIRVQDFLYREGGVGAVILGSSLSARIPVAGSGLSNLALAGGSALTGAEILLRSGKFPKVVFVEVSTVILRDTDTSFLNAVFHPVNYRLREWIPATREVEQPVSRLNQFLKQHFGRGVESDSVVPAELREFQIEDHMREFGELPADPAALPGNMAALGGLLDRIRAHGSHVFFFEAPVEPRLRHLPLMEAAAAAFHQRFPEGPYEWLSLPDRPPFETVDGIHLNKLSAARLGDLLVAAYRKGNQEKQETEARPASLR